MPLEIINNARRYARMTLIGSLAENTEDARLSDQLYRSALRWLSRKSEWNFQTVSICPDKLPEADCCNMPNGFKYAFHYPSDAVRIAAVCQKICADDCKEDLPVHWREMKLPSVSGYAHAVVTDCDAIKVEYICMPDDCAVGIFPQELRDALTYRLAQEFYLINNDDANSERFRQMADKSVSEGKSINTRQGERDVDLDDGFLVESRCW